MADKIPLMQKYRDKFQQLKVHCVKNRIKFYQALIDAIDLYLKK